MGWRGGARVCLAVYLAVLVFVLFNPSGELPSRTVLKVWMWFFDLGLSPTSQTAVRIEFVLNVLILVPATFLAALSWPRIRWEQWTAYAFVFSFGVEMTQSLFPERSATYSDVVANTLGGFVGAVAAALVLWALRRRHPAVGSAAVGSSR